MVRCMHLPDCGCNHITFILPVIMAGWEINKGIGRSVEFKGLKAQYLFIFAGGLLAVFLVTVILYLCNVDQVLCLVMGVLGATVVVWQTFSMNSKYGEHGLMKRGAVRGPSQIPY